MNPQIITLSKDLPIPLYHQLKTLLLVRREQGRGPFVAEPKLAQGPDQTASGAIRESAD